MGPDKHEPCFICFVGRTEMPLRNENFYPFRARLGMESAIKM